MMNLEEKLKKSYLISYIGIVFGKEYATIKHESSGLWGPMFYRVKFYKKSKYLGGFTCRDKDDLLEGLNKRIPSEVDFFGEIKNLKELKCVNHI